MNGDSGFYTSNGNVVTFEVQGAISRDGMANSEYHNLYARYLNYSKSKWNSYLVGDRIFTRRSRKEREKIKSRFGFRSKTKRSCLGLNRGRLTGTGISGIT